MKTWMKFSGLVILTLALVWVFKQQPQQDFEEDNQSQAAQTENHHKKPIQKNAATKKPQKVSKRTPANSPASLNANDKSQKPGPFFPRRRGMGQFKGLQAINTPHPKWEEKAKESLLRFKFKTKNFKMNHIESVARKEGESYRNLEWVKISYTRKGFPQSYDALIDSETGKIARTWNHMKYEPMFNRHRKLSFSLGGILESVEDEED